MGVQAGVEGRKWQLPLSAKLIPLVAAAAWPIEPRAQSDSSTTMPKSRGAKNGARHSGAASTNPNRTADAKAKASGSHVRSKATINRLNMYRTKVKRNKSGKIVKGGLAVGETVREMKAARVQPDRRWFGNTRVVGQKELTEFREQMEQTSADPYAVLLKRNKLPMGLLASGGVKKGRIDLLRAESFKVRLPIDLARRLPSAAHPLPTCGCHPPRATVQSTFGKQQQRKRPKLVASELSELLSTAESKAEGYTEEGDTNIDREVRLRSPTGFDAASGAEWRQTVPACGCVCDALRLSPRRWSSSGPKTTSSTRASRSGSAPSS